MLPSFSFMATRSSFSRSPSSDGLTAMGSGFEQLPTMAVIMITAISDQTVIPRINFTFVFMFVMVFMLQKSA
jgi:hypothetical protein